jgi:hypothetical protein
MLNGGVRHLSVGTEALASAVILATVSGQALQATAETTTPPPSPASPPAPAGDVLSRGARRALVHSLRPGTTTLSPFPAGSQRPRTVHPQQ